MLIDKAIEAKSFIVTKEVWKIGIEALKPMLSFWKGKFANGKEGGMLPTLVLSAMKRGGDGYLRPILELQAG